MKTAGSPPKLGLIILIVIAGGLSWWSYRLHERVRATTLATQQARATPEQACSRITDEDKEFECYHEFLEDELDSQGATVALKHLTELNQTDAFVKAECHQLAHHIGHHAYDHYGSVAEANKYGNEICWSGYYHGVMERYMAGFSDANLLAAMSTICPAKTLGQYSFDYYNCLHGVGHGVTIRFSNDIFKALPYCDAIPGDWEKDSCYSGVFMQNIIVDGKVHHSKDLKADDPLFPCDAVTSAQKQPCYLMQTSHILQTNNYNYAATFAICDKVEAGYVSTCYQSMGRDISGNFLLDVDQVLTICALGKSAHQGDCYVGAAKNAVFNDRGPANADRLCDRVPQAYRGVCVDARNEAVSTL